jgi:predicted lipoprotein with Yx(FWY)xxD motif
MKKNTAILIGVAVIIVLVVGGFALFHKSDNKTPATTTSSAAQKTTASTADNAVFVTKNDSALGAYLADPSGKPLYTYDKDAANTSNCTGSCLSNWPAYQATSSSASLPSGVSTIKRTDNGQTQYTYNGMPLYYFTGDTAGNVTGNGVEIFTVAKPASSSSSSTSPSSNPSTQQDTGSSSPYNY